MPKDTRRWEGKKRGKKNKDKEQLDRTLDNKNRKENVSVTLPYLEAFRLNCLWTTNSEPEK